MHQLAQRFRGAARREAGTRTSFGAWLGGGCREPASVRRSGRRRGIRRAEAAQVLHAAPVAPLAVQPGASTSEASARILLGFHNGPQRGLALRPDHPVAFQSYPSSNWGHGDHSLRAVSCPQSLMKSHDSLILSRSHEKGEWSSLAPSIILLRQGFGRTSAMARGNRQALERGQKQRPSRPPRHVKLFGLTPIAYCKRGSRWRA